MNDQEKQFVWFIVALALLVVIENILLFLEIFISEKVYVRKNEQMDLFEYRKDEIIQELQAIDVMALTPMDAMNKLFLLKEKARKV